MSKPDFLQKLEARDAEIAAQKAKQKTLKQAIAPTHSRQLANDQFDAFTRVFNVPKETARKAIKKQTGIDVGAKQEVKYFRFRHPITGEKITARVDETWTPTPENIQRTKDAAIGRIAERVASLPFSSADVYGRRRSGSVSKAEIAQVKNALGISGRALTETDWQNLIRLSPDNDPQKWADANPVPSATDIALQNVNEGVSKIGKFLGQDAAIRVQNDPKAHPVSRALAGMWNVFTSSVEDVAGLPVDIGAEANVLLNTAGDATSDQRLGAAANFPLKALAAAGTAMGIGAGASIASQGGIKNVLRGIGRVVYEVGPIQNPLKTPDALKSTAEIVSQAKAAGTIDEVHKVADELGKRLSGPDNAKVKTVATSMLNAARVAGSPIDARDALSASRIAIGMEKLSREVDGRKMLETLVYEGQAPKAAKAPKVKPVKAVEPVAPAKPMPEVIQPKPADAVQTPPVKPTPKPKAEPVTPKVETPPPSGERVFTMVDQYGQNDRVVTLSPEQARLMDEADAAYLERSKTDKHSAMQHAIEKRKISGLLTPTMLKDLWTNSKMIRQGDRVKVGKYEGTIATKPAYGKVKIRLDNGSVITSERVEVDKLNPPLEVGDMVFTERAGPFRVDGVDGEYVRLNDGNTQIWANRERVVRYDHPAAELERAARVQSPAAKPAKQKALKPAKVTVKPPETPTVEPAVTVVPEMTPASKKANTIVTNKMTPRVVAKPSSQVAHASAKIRPLKEIEGDWEAVNGLARKYRVQVSDWNPGWEERGKTFQINKGAEMKALEDEYIESATFEDAVAASKIAYKKRSTLDNALLSRGKFIRDEHKVLPHSFNHDEIGTGLVNGEEWWTNRHVAFKGSPPVAPSDSFRPSIEKIVPEYKGEAELEFYGSALFSMWRSNAFASVFKSKDGDIVALNAKHVAAARKHLGKDVSFVGSGSTKPVLVVKNGKTVGVIMPLDNDRVKALVNGDNHTKKSPLSQDLATPKRGAKGQYYWDVDQKRGVVTLLKGADITTLVHETAHHNLRYLGDGDWKAVARAAGYSGPLSVDELQAQKPGIYTKVQEFYARGVEAAIYGGNIATNDPNAGAALAHAAKKFKAIYGEAGVPMPTKSAKKVLNQASPQTQTPEFKRWFGDSKVVDENGEPLVVYHGTKGQFQEFSFEHTGKGVDQFGSGFYFTKDADAASMYASDAKGSYRDSVGSSGNVIPAFVAIRNPVGRNTLPMSKAQILEIIKRAPNLDDGLWNWGDLSEAGGRARALKEAVFAYSEYNDDFLSQWHAIANDFFGDDYIKELNFATNKATGYDGVIADGEIVAWFPTQIKSAIANKGTFDPNNPSILRQAGGGGGFKPDPVITELFARMMNGDVKSAATPATKPKAKMQSAEIKAAEPYAKSDGGTGLARYWEDAERKARGLDPTKAPATPKAPTAAKSAEPYAKGGDGTGLARYWEDAERKARGLDPTKAPAQSVDALAEAGKELAKSLDMGPYASKLLAEGDELTPAQIAALAAHKREVLSRWKKVLATPSRSGELSGLEHELETINQLAQRARTQFNQIGRSLQVGFEPDWTLSTIMARAKAAYGGGVPDKVAGELKGYVDRIAALEKELAEATKVATITKESVSPMSRKNARSTLKALGYTVLNQDAPGQVPKMSQDSFARAIRTLAREVIDESGEVSFDSVVDGIKAKVSGLSDEDILAALSGRYKKARIEMDVQKSRIQRAMNQLRRDAEFNELSTAGKAMRTALSFVNSTGRTLKASLDVSAPFIQGLPSLMSGNAKGWAVAFKESMKGVKGGMDAMDTVMAEIAQHPMYARARAAGVQLSDGISYTSREEQFMDEFTRKLHRLGKVGDVIAKPYQSSEAMYTIFLNKLRFEMFVKMASAAPDDAAYLKDIGSMVNVLTGRGTGKVADFMGNDVMAGVFFAPRYNYSLWQNAFGRPITGATTKAGRALAMKVYAKQAASIAGIAGLVHAMGGKMDLDPSSQTFGYIQLPDGTRVNPYGKVLEPLRTVAQLFLGSISNKGNYTAPGSFNAMSMFDYAERKVSPAARLLGTVTTGKVYDSSIEKSRTAKPYDVLSDFFTPMAGSSAYSSYQAGGMQRQLAFLEFLGISSKGPKTSKKPIPPIFERKVGLREMLSGSP